MHSRPPCLPSSIKHWTGRGNFCPVAKELRAATVTAGVLTGAVIALRQRLRFYCALSLLAARRHAPTSEPADYHSADAFRRDDANIDVCASLHLPSYSLR